jgi:acetolactate synthase-1/2/3 large subunit
VLTEPTAAAVQTAAAAPVPDLSPSDAGRFLAALKEAQRPALIVGGPGWSQSIGEHVARFGRRNAVPVATAFRWQDAVDNTDPSFAGYLGLGCNPALRRRLAAADLLIAFGPRLDDPTTDGFRLLDAPGRRVVVSQDQAELARPPLPHIGIHANLSSAAGVLASIDLSPAEGRRRWFVAAGEEQQHFGRRPAPPTGPDLAAIVGYVRAALPDDAIVTNGAGNYTIWLQRFFAYRRFGTQLAPRNGAMGYGVPAGLAAAALYPDRRVVTFAGDGCFLMSGHELATAVQHDLRVVVIVVNNNRFGTIRMHQERNYPGRVIATDLRNPDFAAYARSFGASGTTVTRTEEFPAAFDEALACGGPALIEVRTDPDQLAPAL